MSAAGARKRLAVVGRPISHSLSPRMHSAALAELGLDSEWSYEAIELEPERFAAAVSALPGQGFVGLNVTIPHKRAALELASSASAAAAAIGAANTLSFGGDEIKADNTDAPGLIAALPADPSGQRALVLGAGGAARAAIWALREAGAEVSVINRTAGRATELGLEFGVSAFGAGETASAADFELIVNATAIGLGGRDDAEPSSPGLAEFKPLGVAADQFSDRQVVVDLVYGPTETELVRAARNGGAETVDGLEILVRQGAESLRLWTGLDPPLATMRRAVQRRST